MTSMIIPDAATAGGVILEANHIYAYSRNARGEQSKRDSLLALGE